MRVAVIFRAPATVEEKVSTVSDLARSCVARGSNAVEQVA
jgi:hypothetical protein